jgi:hypothetical protein
MSLAQMLTNGTSTLPLSWAPTSLLVLAFLYHRNETNGASKSYHDHCLIKLASRPVIYATSGVATKDLNLFLQAFILQIASIRQNNSYPSFKDSYGQLSLLESVHQSFVRNTRQADEQKSTKFKNKPSTAPCKPHFAPLSLPRHWQMHVYLGRCLEVYKSNLLESVLS